MPEIRYTLVSEGSSDRALLPILDWVLQENGVVASQSTWPDLRILPIPPKRMQDRIAKALELSPCDLLFVHRDSDRASYKTRKAEILTILESVTNRPSAICVVPVRMQEAWLLISESAIRFAANNPRGKKPLKLPESSSLEKIPNPKAILDSLILDACELTGRHLKSFKKSELRQAPHRVSQFIRENPGFASLRKLTAFQHLETDIQQVIGDQGWR